jgi:heterodisulfide reductase subunit B
MKYLYYPGCSLEGTAKEYDISTRALAGPLEMELIDLDDWTCCGATAGVSAGHWLALALPGRNLAIAEKMAEAPVIMVPCSACYLNMKTTEVQIRKKGDILNRINQCLAPENLALEARTITRHLLDVLSRDVGPGKIKSKVKKPLDGWTIAPYYGCQCLRPHVLFDDPEQPTSMEPLLKAAGAQIHDWSMGAKCCGASHMNTKPETAIELVAAILKGAKGADAIATVCPMCQMNIEGYQKKISSLKGEDLSIPVLYLPQALGLAMGLSSEELGLELNLTMAEKVLRHCREAV